MKKKKNNKEEETQSADDLCLSTLSAIWFCMQSGWNSKGFVLEKFKAGYFNRGILDNV